MNSSSSSLSSDWDVLSQNLVAGNSFETSFQRKPLSSSWKETKSGVDDEISPPMVSGVDDINDAADGNQDHNTSSDIEVIEETLEDLIQLPAPTVTYSINPSISADCPECSIPPPVPVELGWGMLYLLFRRNLGNSLQRVWEKSLLKFFLVECCMLVFLCIFFAIAINMYGTLIWGTSPNDMKDQLEILKKENDYFKEQIEAMRSENQMLSKSSNDMKDQIEILKKGKDNFEDQIETMISEKQNLSKSMQLLEKNMEEVMRSGSSSTDMKDQIEILKKENDYFKEQIEAMRSENQKLSKSMQWLEKNLEEAIRSKETITFRFG